MENKVKALSSILVANRGEIAVRVFKSARDLGLKTIAVYSDADKNADHVKAADIAIHIGDSPAISSYLDQEKILKAALDSGADCIHPGYGFLSENYNFVKKCESHGITFVGPSSEAMRLMGDKSEAKKIMVDANVPVVPGYHGEDQNVSKLKQEASDITMPILIKANAGGGGKGMRLVEDLDDFEKILIEAKAEAAAAFGNDTVLVEKFVRNPRHIEVQIFGDNHGNVIHLWERDCSVQRNHQKVLEEAPAPGISSAWREKICNAAVAAAKAVNYSGAGTVEFLVDPDDVDENGDPAFYFMEMNTRLQVEHPVTEMISGLDLVHLQIIGASNKPLPIQQIDVPKVGHSIEARIYAEDPFNNWMPSTGKLQHLYLPEYSSQDKFIRADKGFSSGDVITPHYDAMLAKLIVWDKDRDSALQLMEQALSSSRIVGVENNIDFCLAAVQNSNFQAGGITTRFIPDNPEISEQHPPDMLAWLGAGLVSPWIRNLLDREMDTPWNTNFAGVVSEQTFINAHDPTDAQNVKISSTPFNYSPTEPQKLAQLNTRNNGESIGSDTLYVSISGSDGSSPDSENVYLEISDLNVSSDSHNTSDTSGFGSGSSSGDNTNTEYSGMTTFSGLMRFPLAEEDGSKSITTMKFSVQVYRDSINGKIHVWTPYHYEIKIPEPKWVTAVKEATSHQDTDPLCRSPMPGQVKTIIASKGQDVKAGDIVGTVVSMKVNHNVYANIDGTVENIFVEEGQDIDQNQPILAIQPIE